MHHRGYGRSGLTHGSSPRLTCRRHYLGRIQRLIWWEWLQMSHSSCPFIIHSIWRHPIKSLSETFGSAFSDAHISADLQSWECSNYVNDASSQHHDEPYHGHFCLEWDAECPLSTPTIWFTGCHTKIRHHDAEGYSTWSQYTELKNKDFTIDWLTTEIVQSYDVYSFGDGFNLWDPNKWVTSKYIWLSWYYSSHQKNTFSVTWRRIRECPTDA